MQILFTSRMPTSEARPTAVGTVDRKSPSGGELWSLSGLSPRARQASRWSSMNSNPSRYDYAVACRAYARDALGSRDVVAITHPDNEASEPFGKSGCRA